MNFCEMCAFLVSGMAFGMGVPAMLYAWLPQSAWESAKRHGRYAGLGQRSRADHTPRGRSATNQPALVELYA